MSEMQAMFAVRNMPEVAEQNNNAEYSFSNIQKLLSSHFKVLDESIQRVFEHIKPENYIVTSDHGCVPYLYHANADALLLEKGLQFKPAGVSGSAKSMLKSFVKQMLPKSLIKNAIKASPGINKILPPRFDQKLTKAFSNYYMQGVYINDAERFGGPLVNPNDINSLVDEICEAINSDPISAEYEMNAYAYRRKFKDRKFEQFLPDIHIQKPDSMFFTNTGSYVSRNERYGPLDDDLSNATDMHSGQKSRYPLFSYNPEISSLDPSECNDLTAIYELAKRVLS